MLQRARSEFPDEPRLYAWQEMLAWYRGAMTEFTSVETWKHTFEGSSAGQERSTP